jgi:hypothetical protein
MNRYLRGSAPLLVAALALLTVPDASAQAPATIGPNLNQFSVFGSGGVVGSAGGTTVNGDVGGFATCGVTNFPPSTVVPPFIVHGPACDGVVAAADTEATTAFNSLSQAGAVAINPSLNLVNVGSGVGVLVPGNYSTGAAILPTNTTLTFNGNGIYVIQVASSLTVVTGPATNMILAGGANACDIYWQVGSSASIEVQPGRQFVGQVFANTAATLTAGNVVGRLIALNAAATLSNGGNTVGGCATAGPVPPIPPGPGGPPVPALPDLAAAGLLAVLLVSGVLLARR